MAVALTVATSKVRSTFHSAIARTASARAHSTSILVSSISALSRAGASSESLPLRRFLSRSCHSLRPPTSTNRQARYHFHSDRGSNLDANAFSSVFRL